MLGLLAGLLAAGMLARVGLGLVSGLRTSPVAVPGTASYHLDRGTFNVYQLADGHAYRIQPAQVTVTGPYGQLPIGQPSMRESVQQQSGVYEAVVQFQARVAGDYTVTVASEDESKVLVAPSIATTLRGSAEWFAMGALSFIVLMIGVALVIGGVVQRRHHA